MLKVLIAEDDPLLANMLDDILVRNGYEVCGIARTVDEAVALCTSQKPDLAVLDVRLADGGFGTEIVARLDRGSRPGILYATANKEHITLANADGDACISKPYCTTDVVWALELVQQIVTTGKVTRPFPMGFHVLEAPSKSHAAVVAMRGESADAFRQLRRQQAALAGFSNFALFVGGIGDVLTEAARVCAKGLDAPFSSVSRYRRERNDLIVEAGVGWHEGVIGCVMSGADESSPQGRAFTTGEPVICSDLSTDARFALPPFYAEHGIISALNVIIKKDNQAFGVLEINSPVRHDYEHDDISFLTAFAFILAEAINRSKLGWPPKGEFRRGAWDSV
jgi:DNA-binding response OmpR family regulator/putative methionine-R-sulfoxide reductase with GAF domain